MDLSTRRIDSQHEDHPQPPTAQQPLPFNKLRGLKLRASKDNSRDLRQRSRNKLQFDNPPQNPYQVILDNRLIDPIQREQDSNDLSQATTKTQKISKRQAEAMTEDRQPNNKQLVIRLPPIRNRMFDVSESKRVGDLERNNRSLKNQEDREMVRSNSNSTASQGGSAIGCLNIKGLSVNSKEPRRSKLVLYRDNDENKPKNTESQQVKQQLRYLKQELKKDITIVRNSKKRSIIKKQKRFNNTIHDFLFFINWTNRMEHSCQPTTVYKAWIGKGNNSILIKNTLKSRFWWNIVDSECADANLNWTQSRNQKYIQGLKCGEELNMEAEVLLKHSESQSPGRHKTFLFQVPKEKEGKNRTFYSESTNGLRKLASNKDLQNSKDNYSVEIQTQKIVKQFLPPNLLHVHNHLQFNWNLSNKKALYFNLKTYYQALNLNPFDFIPVTFHVQAEGDKEWNNFLGYYNSRMEELKEKRKEGVSGYTTNVVNTTTNTTVKNKKKKEKNVWIIKPGENSNRGCGIDVCDTIEGIKEIIKTKALRPNGKRRTHIIQSYIMPFLYCKRKFDIRCYILVTSINDIVKGYWYEEGYIRTSCKQFTLKNLTNRMIHLTNDAVQKKSEDYGKFENANKISFSDFQKYLDNTHPQMQYNFGQQIYPNMIKLASDAIRSTSLSLDSNRREFTFQVFGLDFMIDQNFKVWLIEVNTNPCLELSSPLLARIIPSMIENALKIGLDPLFPPPRDWPKKKPMPAEFFQTNKFTLIFDSLEERKALKQVLHPTNLANVIEIEEESDMDDEDEQQQ